MMTIDEIRALLNDLESDRVERTISTTNTDKFGQAICAFANDLPDHRMPGYLFLGVAENGEAIYDFSYQTAVMVTEMKSPRGERATAEAIANGFLTEEDLQKRSEKGSDLTIFEGKPSQKPSNLAENDQRPSEKPSNLTENEDEKQPNLSISDFPTMVTWNVYQAIKLNRKAKYSWLQDNLGVSESTILRAINDLKKLRYIDPEHSKVKGEWQLLK